MSPESKIGLERGDGGPQWGLGEIAKTHLITSVLYPVCLLAGLMHNPRAVVRELLTKGPKPSYKELYKDMARQSVYWTPDEPEK